MSDDAHRIRVAEELLRVGKIAEAEAKANEALSSDVHCMPAQLTLARVHIEQGRYQSAAEFRAALGSLGHSFTGSEAVVEAVSAKAEGAVPASAGRFAGAPPVAGSAAGYVPAATVAPPPGVSAGAAPLSWYASLAWAAVAIAVFAVFFFMSSHQ